MTGRVIYSLNQAAGRVFPERRLYVRSDARTRYWTLSPISQAGFASIFALALVMGPGPGLYLVNPAPGDPASTVAVSARLMTTTA